MSLPLRELGNTGIKLAAIGYGAMGLAGAYGKRESQETVDACLNEVIKQGIQMIDTSDIYTDFSTGKLGLNEETIGAFLKTHPGAREKLFIATKSGFGIDMKTHGDREYVLKAADASLERLGIEQIDLYYHHRPSATDIAETAGALRELKEAGKIKYVGVSEYTLEQLKRFNDVVHIDAYQIEVSPWTPEIFKNGLAQWCEQNGTAIIAYSPLGRGFLTGSIKTPADIDDDFRKSNPRYQGENFKKNLELVDALQAVGKEKGYTGGQIAIAWVLSKSKNIIPIPGSTKPERIAENTIGAKIELTADELEQINGIIDSFQVSDGRYSDGQGLAF
ncbi:hypothetical protein V8E36_008629 [Tilletia maclaganii]